MDDGSVVVMTLNLYDAKTQLSALVDQAAAGAEIIIAKNGKPMAKLVPFRERPRGSLDGSRARSGCPRTSTPRCPT